MNMHAHIPKVDSGLYLSKWGKKRLAKGSARYTFGLVSVNNLSSGIPAAVLYDRWR